MAPLGKGAVMQPITSYEVNSVIAKEVSVALNYNSWRLSNLMLFRSYHNLLPHVDNT